MDSGFSALRISMSEIAVGAGVGSGAGLGWVRDVAAWGFEGAKGVSKDATALKKQRWADGACAPEEVTSTKASPPEC